MKLIPLLSLFAAALALSHPAMAQTPAAPAPGATPAAAKPQPLSGSDTRTLLEFADSLQFQLNMALRINSKFKDGDAGMLTLAGGIRKETTEIWTPMVDMAQAGGVDGKKIPQSMSKTDVANVNKLSTIKDEKKWTLAFMEHFAKESKKNAHSAEGGIKTLQDPTLKTWAEKAAALLKSQSEKVDAKYQELKTAKK